MPLPNAAPGPCLGVSERAGKCACMHACRGGSCCPVAHHAWCGRFLTSRRREQAHTAATEYRQSLDGGVSSDEQAKSKVLNDTCATLQQLLQACSQEKRATGAFAEKHHALQAALAVMLAGRREYFAAPARMLANCYMRARAACQHARRKSAGLGGGMADRWLPRLPALPSCRRVRLGAAAISRSREGAARGRQSRCVTAGFSQARCARQAARAARAAPLDDDIKSAADIKSKTIHLPRAWPGRLAAGSPSQQHRRQQCRVSLLQPHLIPHCCCVQARRCSLRKESSRNFCISCSCRWLPCDASCSSRLASAAGLLHLFPYNFPKPGRDLALV